MRTTLRTPASHALVLATVLAAVLGMGWAAVLDALRIGSFASHRVTSIFGVAVLGGLEAALLPALFHRRPTMKRALVGALVGALGAFVVSRAPLGWLDLGAIAAGAPGDLPLFVIPLVTTLAVFATWPREETARRR